MATNKVVYGDRTLIDLTSDSVTPGSLLQGETAHDRSGAQITGTLSDFTGATSSTAGTHGLVPAPSAGDENKVLKGNGTWDDASDSEEISYLDYLSLTPAQRNDGTARYIPDYPGSGGGGSSLADFTGATASADGRRGFVPAPLAGEQEKFLKGNGTWATLNLPNDMTGATSSADGDHGLVPAPLSADRGKFLRGDGAWADVPVQTRVKGSAESEYRTGDVNLTPANIGLGNVDNTADANKSVNYATSAGSAGSATVASQLGSSTVGSSSVPIYLLNGVPTQMSDWFNQSVKTNADVTHNGISIVRQFNQDPHGIYDLAGIQLTDSTSGKWSVIGLDASYPSNGSLISRIFIWFLRSAYIWVGTIYECNIFKSDFTYQFYRNSDWSYQAINASAFNVGSSKRIKENVKELTDKEAKKILDVDIVTFDYKEEFGGEKDQRGVIAEDVIDIIPSVVHIDERYDENKPIDGDNPPPSIDYSKFVPYLIKMIQLQQDKIEELEARIEALEGE